LFGLSSAKSKPWETAGRRATELKEGSPSDASRAARVVNALAAFCVFYGRFTMKSIQVGHDDNKAKSFYEGVWQLFVLSLLAFTLLCFSTESHSAQITFAQNGLTVKVAPGETVAVPITVSLEDTSLPNTYASFGVKVPTGAQRGFYTGVLKTVYLRSNESVEPAELKINVDVDSLVGCSQPPLFSNVVALQETINMRNNKLVQIELSGSVAVTEGCEIYKTQYHLKDEYGELDNVADIQLDDEGSFTVAVPMVASRKGSDKDGRLYTVKFVAENEAGLGESI
jgi:hypothetical protein